MKYYMDKRATGGLGISGKGSNLPFRDATHEDGSIRCCNRMLCSTRFYSIEGSQFGHPETAKYPKTSLRSMSSMTIAGSSSKSFSASSDYRKKHQERRRVTSVQAITNKVGKVEVLESRNRPGEPVVPDSAGVKSVILQDFSENVSETLENRDTRPSLRTRKQINQQRGSVNLGISSCPSVRHSVASNKPSLSTKHAPERAQAGAQRHVLKNLGSTSVPNVLPSSCSFSDSGCNRKVELLRKRSADGERSYARGKSTRASSSGGYSHSRYRGFSTSSLSPPERLMPLQASRRVTNRPTNKDGVVSVRTAQASRGESRTRLLEEEDDSFLPLPIITSEMRQTHYSVFQNLPGNSSTGTVCGILGERDGYHSFNMDGIAEVLLSLERIEQDEELTYEQLLMLESNLSLEGLTSHDQHRDMRLDIDNMSYEELLALEEKMGTVSTALTEEALSKCLKRSYYTPASHAPGIIGRGGNDTKCCICQEEYTVGDEVGKLACEHDYHEACIHQWLRRKNWCAICKAPACSS